MANLDIPRPDPVRRAERLVITPVMVGRARELETLDRALGEAQTGRGGCLLIAGDAGVGKTRMLVEAALLAGSTGFLVFTGACFEQDRAFPYAPVIDALRAQFARRSPGELEHLLGPFGPELVKLVPELVLILPGIRPTAPLDPEAEKRRLFESLNGFLVRLAAIQPVLLVLEDLHWSDDLSLDLLHLLARRCSAHRLLLLTSHRPEEAPPRLTQLMAEFDRSRLARVVTLDALTRAGVDAMVCAILDLAAPSPAGLLDPLFALTEGNPFNVEELLKSLIDAGELVHESGRWQLHRADRFGIPPSVRDAVQRRTARLGDIEREVLTHAAVAGRRFEFRLLCETTGLTERELLNAMDVLVAAQLVVEETADRLAFRHALTREAIHAMLLRREQQTLHRKVAEALERVHAHEPDRYAADLGYHYHAAGEWPKALEWAFRAGVRARSLYAPRAAIEHFNRALDAAEHIDALVSSDLLLARAKAYETTGYFEPARADIESAIDVARGNGDHATEWRGLIALGRLWASRDYGRTGEYFGRALALARSVDDRTIIANSLNRLGNWRANVGQPAEALRDHGEALDLLVAVDDRRGVVETLDLIGMASQLDCDFAGAYGAYARAIGLWRDLDDRRGLAATLASIPLCSSLYVHPTDMPAVGLRQAAATCEEGLAIAREIGWRAGEAYALLNLAMTLGPLGKYRPAFDAMAAARVCAVEIEHRQWLTGALAVSGMLHLDVLDFATAVQHLEGALELARAMGSIVWAEVSLGALATAHVRLNQFTRAEQLLSDGLPANASMEGQGRRLCWLARGELALAQSRPEEACRIAEQLHASGRTAESATVTPQVGLLLGRALAKAGHVERALEVLRAARSTAVAQEQRPVLWRLHVAIGKSYREAGSRADADEAFRAARALIGELADDIPDDGVRSTFASRSAATLPRQRNQTRSRTEREKFGGLTTRQREVAMLIARGMSNRDIANELVVGVRTVETHVTQILMQLGFGGRSQIAVWAVEHSLTRPDPRLDS